MDGDDIIFAGNKLHGSKSMHFIRGCWQEEIKFFDIMSVAWNEISF